MSKLVVMCAAMCATTVFAENSDDPILSVLDIPQGMRYENGSSNPWYVETIEDEEVKVALVSEASILHPFVEFDIFEIEGPARLTFKARTQGNAAISSLVVCYATLVDEEKK